MVRVVVVGGGYGGITVAKGLDPIADVVLVEQKDQFVHHAAALRAAVDEVWEHTIFMPYGNLLKRGSIVHGTVSAVRGTTVYVFGHEPIEADFVVLASGSTYPFPAKFPPSATALVKARLEQLHKDLAKAHSVLLVGGGTVGIELTGELLSSFPDLQVTIVEKQPEILSTAAYTQELRDEITSQLDQLGVKVVSGSALAELPRYSAGDLGHFTVKTQNGVAIEADMWFQCYGAQAASGYLDGTEYDEVLRENGTIHVEPNLQVAGHDHVYAVGDITDVRESKRADAARQQARVVIANISRQIEGDQADIQYQPTKEWVILPLGPNMGASQLLDANGQARVLGASQTAEIKGTDLMVSMVRSQLNLP